jgi:hypothetical protein
MERIVIIGSLFFAIIWFLSGNFGATASRHPGRTYSLPVENSIVVKGKEKEEALKAINEIFRNQKL